MNDFPNILNLVRKISSKGWPWFIRRMKRELKTPSFKVFKPIAFFVEFFNKLMRTQNPPQLTTRIKDQILVVYDLIVGPITFDFAYFLAYAETFAKKK